MRIAGLVAVGSMTLALGCTRPDPPELKVTSVAVRGVDLSAVAIQVGIEAKNPNSIALSAQRTTGQVIVDGKYDLGTVTIDTPVNLPAGASTPIEVPLSVKWESVTAAKDIIMRDAPTPFVVKGKVTVGGKHLSVDLPFEAKGTITREQLIEAAGRGLPTLLKGFSLPPIPTAD